MSQSRFVVIFLAVIFIPVIPALGLAIASPGYGGYSIDGIIGFFIVGYVFSFLAVAVIAMPYFLILLKLGWVNRWTTIVSGAGFGALVAVLMRFPNLPEFIDVIRLGSLGLISSIVFWIAWTNATEVE